MDHGNIIILIFLNHIRILPIIFYIRHVPMYKYDSMDDGNHTICARSYYDIIDFL